MSRSQYKEIAQEIGRKLSPVSTFGQVHLFIRPITESSKLKELMFTPELGTICGWIITRESFADQQIATDNTNQINSTFVLRGYYGLSDKEDSELDFQQWVDDAHDAFYPQDDLNETCEIHYPVQARQLTHVAIGDMLCHYAELTIEVQEYVN